MKTIMNENYYDIPELSKMFGLSEHTIRKYCNTGKISAMKIGKSWTAKESDIIEYLNNTRRNTEGSPEVSKHPTETTKTGKTKRTTKAK